MNTGNGKIEKPEIIQATDSQGIRVGSEQSREQSNNPSPRTEQFRMDWCHNVRKSNNPNKSKQSKWGTGRVNNQTDRNQSECRMTDQECKANWKDHLVRTESLRCAYVAPWDTKWRPQESFPKMPLTWKWHHEAGSACWHLVEINLGLSMYFSTMNTFDTHFLPWVYRWPFALTSAFLSFTLLRQTIQN